MKQYRILWKFNTVGNMVYLPQIKGWIFWSKIPLQVPTIIDVINSPWSNDLNWCRRQIETHYTRSKLKAKTGIIESIDYETKDKPIDRPYCGICAAFDIDNIDYKGYSYCNITKIPVHRNAVVCKEFGI
jgi:hypothetical protein